MEEMPTWMRMECLRDKTINDTTPGVSENRICDEEVIVSLTTFGKRIDDVYLAIESIMQGTLKPNRIVLWLSKEEFEGKRLPITLQKQQRRGLEIRFCDDIRSYTKLIPSLHAFPEACIITIDDDAMYEFDIVERLVNTHLEHPDAICSCRIHKVRLDENDKPMGYLKWEWEVEDGEVGSPLLFATGVGGVLYPPHCFPEEVFNERVFTSICAYADDIWFYAMRLLNNTPVVKTVTSETPCYLTVSSSSINALSDLNTNSADCRNDTQLTAVFEKYGLYEKLKAK